MCLEASSENRLSRTASMQSDISKPLLMCCCKQAVQLITHHQALPLRTAAASQRPHPELTRRCFPMQDNLHYAIGGWVAAGICLLLGIIFMLWVRGCAGMQTAWQHLPCRSNAPLRQRQFLSQLHVRFSASLGVQAISLCCCTCCCGVRRWSRAERQANAIYKDNPAADPRIRCVIHELWLPLQQPRLQRRGSPTAVISFECCCRHPDCLRLRPCNA